jgi:hypothetical protein
MTNEILQDYWASLVSRPTCSVCGGFPQPAVRTRQAAIGTQKILYLAEQWACSVCGRTWEDHEQRKINGQAARAARNDWIAHEMPRRLATPFLDDHQIDGGTASL